MKLKFILLFAVTSIFIGVKSYAQVTYDWTGLISSSWTNPLNWSVSPAFGSPGIPSASTDKIRIGVNALFLNQPTVSTVVNCDSLTLGAGNTIALLGNPLLTNPSVLNLTINNAFNVKSITVNHANIGTANTAIVYNFLGTGTVNCSGNVQIGNLTAPPTGLGGLTGTVYSRVSWQGALLNITGNVYLNSTGNNAAGVNYPEFLLDNGAVTLAGRIITQNRNTFSGTQASLTVAIRGLFQLDNTTNTTTLTLTNNAAINLPIADGQVVDFTNNGTGNCTVIYNSPSGSQLVYGGTTPRVGRANAIYDNLTLSGASTKVTETNYTAGTPSLTIGANLTTSGGAVDMATNGTQMLVSGNWNNGTVTTQGAGAIQITGAVTNTGTLTLGSGNLNIAGNYTNSSTFTQSTGTVTFDGTTQTLLDNGNGTNFRKVTFTTGGTKTLSAGNFGVVSTGLLTMASNSTLNANGNLTLYSDASSSATVAAIPTGSSITNSVNVQRFLVGGNTKASGAYVARGYRMLSSPTHNGSGFISPLYISNSALTGGSGSGFTVTNANPTIYLYREDVTPSNTTFNSGKHKGIINMAGYTVNVSGVTGTVQIPRGNGYIFYFVGNTSNPSTKATASPTTGPESTAITANGTLNQGNITVNLWYTPGGATAPTTNKLSYTSTLGTSAGYNMVGNPYAATLDLDKVITDNTTIGNSIYVLDNINPGQQYIVYAKGGSSNPRASQYVGSGQGFIVKATTANATLTFRESEKAPNNQPLILLMGMPKTTEAAVTGLYLKIEQDSLINDYCGIYFSSEASAKFTDEDAKDMDGAAAQVYMSSYTSDGVRTAINRLPDYRPGSQTKLYVGATTDGLYKLKIEDIRNIDDLYEIWLKDRFMKDSLDLRAHDTYNFRVTRSDTATFGANRFQLIIRRKILPPYSLSSLTAQKVPEGIKVTWNTSNEGNYTGFELQKMEQGSTTDQYMPVYNVQSSGINTYSFIDKNPLIGLNTYRLKQNDIDERISLSDPVSINLQEPTGNGNLINVYPNPTAENIYVKLNPAEGISTCTAKIYNYSGMLVLQKTLQGETWSQNVARLQPGTYIIELNKTTGELIGRTKFIKR